MGSLVPELTPPFRRLSPYTLILPETCACIALTVPLDVRQPRHTQALSHCITSAV